MLTLSVKIRKDQGRKTEKLREKGIIPAVLYGPKIENLSLETNLKEFEKVYTQAGTSSLVQLEVGEKKFLVLIHAVEIDALSQKPIHVDFYQPRLDEEITATIPLIFEGEAPAVKDFGGTLVRNIHEIEVKALPQNLPHEIRVDIISLKTFEDSIAVKDLLIPKEVKILKGPDEVVVFVAEPEKVEEELAKPVEEKVEEVEKVGEKKEAEEGKEGAEETPAPKQETQPKPAK
ncbi:MAG: 50S ribosomal protein L25 [Candidatus Pacebacteria bacterium]|nr:50S ribosomal protein L25 [Candidatus Paceibacterota bacterium]